MDSAQSSGGKKRFFFVNFCLGPTTTSQRFSAQFLKRDGPKNNCSSFRPALFFFRKRKNKNQNFWCFPPYPAIPSGTSPPHFVAMVAPSSLSPSVPAHPLAPVHHPRFLRPTHPARKPISPSLAVRCAATAEAGRPGPPPLPPPRLVRCPALDRQAARASRLRFARKLLTLLLSKPRHFLPIRVLGRCRPFLGLPRRGRPRRGRPLIPMVLRYPTLFRLFQAPTSVPLSPSLSTLAIRLTLVADLTAFRATSNVASKLHRPRAAASHTAALPARVREF